MAIEIKDALTRPARGSRVMSIPCPNSYFAYPELTCLGQIPQDVFSTLDPLWNCSVHAGRDVDIYRFQNVFLAKEGLVFDQNAKLIDVTRTLYEEHVVIEAAAKVRTAIETSAFPSKAKGILAKRRGSSNYGHFIYEMLPCAWLARNRLRLAGWPAIIDSAAPAVQAVSTQALNQAGFGSDEVIAVGPSPVFFKEIVVVDGLTSHSRYLSPIAMQCLDAIAESIPTGDQGKLYAARYPVVGRDFEREPEISARLARLGFVTFVGAEMNFVQQVSAFKGAKSIVGVTGAALANTVFCRPGTKIYNFSPSRAMEVLFWMIGESRRLKYREIRCPEIGDQIGGLPWDRAIKISPDEVERIISAS